MNDIKIDCSRLIQKKIGNEMTKEEFYISLMDLHKKYPLPGHQPPMTSTHFKHYRNTPRVTEYNGIKFLNKIHPINFFEAAQMYAQGLENNYEIDVKSVISGE